MTDPDAMDLPQVAYRLKAVESTLEAHGRQYGEIRLEMVRMDEGLRGVREQAKSHNDAHVRAVADIKDQMAKDRISVETLLNSSVRELQQGIDKLIGCLGIDDDIHAASQLRHNLKVLSDMISDRKTDIKWIRGGIITLVITAVGTVLALGIRSFIIGG